MKFRKIVRLFLLMIIIQSIPSFAQKTMVINELSGSNDEVFFDEMMECNDWIELYNASDEAINLKDYGISKKKDYKKAWK